MNLLNRIFVLTKENNIKKINKQILRNYNKASVLFEMRKFEESLIIFESIEPILSKEIEVLKRNNNENQLKKMNHLLFSIWSKKSYLYYYLGDYNESLLFLEKILKEKPNNAGYLFNKGYLLYKTENYNTALEFFKKALENEYEYAEAWYYSGIILDIFDNYDMAHKAFDNAILYLKPEYFPFPKFSWFSYLSSNRLKYNNSEIWFNKSKIYFKQKDFKNALSSIDKALEIESNEKMLMYKNKLIQEIKKRNINLYQS